MNSTPSSLEPKIRVLIVTQHLDKGGLEEVILTYARFLDRERYDVAVAFRVGGIVSSELARLPGVQLVCYDAPGRWQRIAALRRFVRAFKPDIVHNHFNWYGLIIGVLGRARRVETIHNTYHWFTTTERIAYSLYCLLASRVIAVSHHVASFSRRFFPLLRLKKIIVIHNSVNPERFQPVSRGEVRRSLGISSDEIVIGFIGRLEEQKGITYLLQAVAEISRENPKVRVVIVGEGTMKPHLHAHASSLGLTAALFLGYRRDTPQLLGMLDVFVLPSLFEGLPVVLIEAMAAGCCVVATRIGGIEEVVTDRVDGILVEARNASALAAALRELIANPGLRKRLGDAARRRAAEEFSVHTMIKKTEDVYRHLLPHHRALAAR